MANYEDGGSVYPFQIMKQNPVSGETQIITIPGMSVRDHYAGQAFGSLLLDAMSKRTSLDDEFPIPEQIAKKCYEYAQALVNERERILSLENPKNNKTLTLKK